jgi:hypothetical protein
MALIYLSDGVYAWWTSTTTVTPPDGTTDDQSPELVESWVHAETQDQIATLLQADHIEVDFGAWLWTLDESVSVDITDDIMGGSVSRNCFDTMHGTCRLELTREVDWVNYKLQPYITLKGDGYWEHWFMGMYHPDTPDSNLGLLPTVYSAQGIDKLTLLSRPIGDSYYVASGTAYLDAVATVIADAGITGAAAVTLFDTTAADKTLTADMVWILDDAETTYLSVINDLLRAIGYRGLYVGRFGFFIAEPYLAPTYRTPVWTFDLSDAATSLVGEDRGYSEDQFNRTNWRRAIKTGLTAAPVETAADTTTDTQYTIDDSDGGTQYRRIYYLDVEDGNALYDELNRIKNEETQCKRRVEITTGPMPLIWHFDTVKYKDTEMGSAEVKCQVVAWTYDLATGDMRLTLEVIA